MFKRINLFIFVAVLASFITQSAQAFIVHGEVWRKLCPDGTYKTVYCLSDVHFNEVQTYFAKKGRTLNTEDPDYVTLKSFMMKDMADITPVGYYQRDSMFHILDYIPQDELIVLVEDMSSDAYGNMTCPETKSTLNFSMKKSEFIVTMAQDCAHNKIPVINLECRQNKNLLQFYLYNPKHSYCERSINDCERETLARIAEIQSYENEPLSLYTEKELTKYGEARKRFLEDVRSSGIYNPETAMRVDLPLLDLKAINDINALDKKHIVLAMGGRHIKNIVHILPSLGYEKVRECGRPYQEIEQLCHEVTSNSDISKQIASARLLFAEGKEGFKIAELFDFDQYKEQFIPIEEQLKTVSIIDNSMVIQSNTKNQETKL